MHGQVSITTDETYSADDNAMGLDLLRFASMQNTQSQSAINIFCRYISINKQIVIRL